MKKKVVPFVRRNILKFRNKTKCHDMEKVHSLLEKAYKEISSIEMPIFDSVKGIRGAPIRHPYMSAVAWYLAKSTQMDNLTILEIGSYVGSSLFTWAHALNKYAKGKVSIYSVDPLESFLDESHYSAGELSQVSEIEESVKYDFAYQILRHNMNYMFPIGQCVHIRALSSEIMPILKDNTFDLIYIDGNHGYKGVRGDLAESKRLIKNNGILCGDDLEIQGHECDIENAELNSHLDFIVDPKSNMSFHPGVTLAVSETIGKVSSWDGFWAMELKNENWEPISLYQAPLDIPPHFPKHMRDEIKKQLGRMRVLCDDLGESVNVSHTS